MKRVTLKSVPLLTRILLALFLALAITVVFLGLDNAAGIITGMIAASMLVIEFTRRWRSIRKFIYLAVGTFVVAVVISGLYMELAGPLALRIGGPDALQGSAWQVFSIILSDTMLLVGPGCIVIGWAGAIVLSTIRFYRWLQKHRALREHLTPSAF